MGLELRLWNQRLVTLWVLQRWKKKTDWRWALKNQYVFLVGADLQKTVQRSRADKGILTVVVTVSIMGGHNKLLELSSSE